MDKRIIAIFLLLTVLAMTEGKRPKKCKKPKEPGRCLAYMPRYYFNTETKQCEQFIYGGCEGNANNFWTKEECENTCVYKPGSCPTPEGPGICIEECSSDFKCPDDEKCCSNGCGNVCMPPVEPV